LAPLDLRLDPDYVGGFVIHTAVIDGVQSPQEFSCWLAERGLPET
jgi:hypothetical protein